ncbi:hypothetical protein LCGC14_2479430, partial [marine sediment metagenome]
MNNPVRIFVDPGHGGQDSGAIFQGLYEKDVVLQISRVLAWMLENAGYESSISRTSDYFIGLTHRIE